MGKIIMGFIAGYILSDIISQKFPQAQQFKISSLPGVQQTTGAALAKTTSPQCSYVNLSLPMATS
jgi:hypothetical protein